MKRLYIPLMLFLLVVVEGVALDLLPFNSIDTMIVPHFVLVFLVFITVFYDKENRYSAVIYAIIFGLLIDVVYTGILGVYMFSYAIVVYVIHKLKLLVHENFYVTLTLGFIAVTFADIFIYVVYINIGYASMMWGDYVFYRLLPTTLGNLIFLIILYPFLVKRLPTWIKEQPSRNAFL